MNNSVVLEKSKRASLWSVLEWCAFTPPRINRVKYFGLLMTWVSIGLALVIVGALTGVLDFYLMVIIGLICIPNAIILNVRRLHDLNFSGWWVLLTPIPYIGYFICLMVMIWPGSKGENKFGEKPEPAKKWHYVMFLLGLAFCISVFWAAFTLGYYPQF
jgi:uncharacterized membrane protein YhaH (DUF805 family)